MPSWHDHSFLIYRPIFHLSFQYTDQEKSPHPQSIELCKYRHCICFRYFTTCMFNCSKFASSNISKSPNFEKRLHIYKSRFEIGLNKKKAHHPLLWSKEIDFRVVWLRQTWGLWRNQYPVVWDQMVLRWLISLGVICANCAMWKCSTWDVFFS